MKKSITFTALLASTTIATNALAAGDAPESPAGKPTAAEKKDSTGFLDKVLGVPPDPKPSGNKLTKIFTLDDNEFAKRKQLGGDSTLLPDSAFSAPNFIIDGPLDNGLRYNSRIRLDVDTSFTGKDRLRTRVSADDSLLDQLESDLIYGGSSDSIYAGSNDSVFGGSSDTLLGGDPDAPLYGGADSPGLDLKVFDIDVEYGLPAFGGQDTVKEQPRISVNLRDEFAIGFNLGYAASYEDYVALDFDGGDAVINESYENVPSETITFKIGAKIENKAPNLTNYYYRSDFGQVNAQFSDTIGFAFPDLFAGQGLVEGASTWPPRGSSPNSFEPFFQASPTLRIETVPTGLIIYQPSTPPDDAIIGTLRTTFRF